MARRRSLRERFEANVDRNGPLHPYDPAQGPCHLWTASTKWGYGVIRGEDGKQKRAHRVAFEFEHGRVPVGLDVLHSCDRAACVNEAHLSAGTGAENHRQKAERGRSTRGERNVKAKLTAEQVRTIRAQYASGGVRQVDLARRFGVSQATISHVIRLGWAHV